MQLIYAQRIGYTRYLPDTCGTVNTSASFNKRSSMLQRQRTRLSITDKSAVVHDVTVSSCIIITPHDCSMHQQCLVTERMAVDKAVVTTTIKLQVY